MEFLRFIFSSFWVWLGFIVLIAVAFGGVQETVKVCKRNRKVPGYRIGNNWRFEIEGASKDDAMTAIMQTACGGGYTDENGGEAGEDNNGASR